MVASIQLTSPFPVKLCLNITRESKKLNVFRHVDTIYLRCAKLFQWLLVPIGGWYMVRVMWFCRGLDQAKRLLVAKLACVAWRPLAV